MLLFFVLFFFVVVVVVVVVDFCCFFVVVFCCFFFCFLFFVVVFLSLSPKNIPINIFQYTPKLMSMSMQMICDKMHFDTIALRQKNAV